MSARSAAQRSTAVASGRPAGTEIPGTHGPTIGLTAQLALLAALATTTGLGVGGWLIGTGYALAVCVVLSTALHRAGARTMGPANQVTLARATLVGGVAALVAESVSGPVPVGALVVLAGVALALDAVDGQVARRTRTTSTLGARFDMEVDAFLILVLSVFVAQDLGGWVLVIGLTRYAFVVASVPLPWLKAPLPPAMWRKTVAAVQGIVLVVASAGVLPRALTFAVVGLALASLAWSFARDIWWLWRHRAGWPAVPAAVPAAVAAAVPAQVRRVPPVPVGSVPGGPGSVSAGLATRGRTADVLSDHPGSMQLTSANVSAARDGCWTVPARVVGAGVPESAGARGPND